MNNERQEWNYLGCNNDVSFRNNSWHFRGDETSAFCDVVSQTIVQTTCCNYRMIILTAKSLIERFSLVSRRLKKKKKKNILIKWYLRHQGPRSLLMDYLLVLRSFKGHIILHNYRMHKRWDKSVVTRNWIFRVMYKKNYPARVKEMNLI